MAAAPALLPSQVWKAALFPLPSHSTSLSMAGDWMVGAVSSRTVMVCEQVFVVTLLQWSVPVMVQVRTIV